MSKPDWPPSPMIVLTHLLVLPPFSQVPLSCVPPWSWFLSKGLTDRLWNCRVVNPLFMPVSRVGTCDSSCSQRDFMGSTSPRGPHQLDTLANSPLDRMMPPSLASMNWKGLEGFVTM